MTLTRFKHWLLAQFRKVLFPWWPVPLRQVTDEDYTVTENSLTLGIYPRVKNLSISRFLLDENRRIAEAKLASLRALEGKAIAQVGVAGTILALLTAFERDIPFAWKALPLLLLVTAIFSYLRAGYIRSGRLPSVGCYLLDTIEADPDNEARIALQLASAWSQYGLEIEQANAIKAQFTRTGNFWLQAALIALLAVIFLTGRQRQETPAQSVNILNETPTHNSAK